MTRELTVAPSKPDIGTVSCNTSAMFGTQPPLQLHTTARVRVQTNCLIDNVPNATVMKYTIFELQNIK